jgi:hypothetical protein
MNKAICALVGYYDGEIKKFVLDAHYNLALVPKDDVEIPKILIVSRQYYAEKVKSYPVESRKELSKLLKLENPDRESSYYIWNYDNGQSNVNIWQFNKNNPAAFIQLPESLLLSLATQSASSSSKQVLTVDGSVDLYVSQQQGAIYSSLKSVMINSAQRFIISAGLSQASQHSVISSSQLAVQFPLGLQKVSLALWSVFINKSSSSTFSLSTIKKVVTPSVGIICCYLMVSSGYLLIKGHNLQSKLQQHSVQINQALNKQQQLDLNITRYTQLNIFFEQQDLISPLWLALAKILPEVNISNIRKVGNRYVIRGTSDKATKTLEEISLLDNVIDAKFDTPSKKSRSQERFTIGFSLQHHSLNLFLSKQDVSSEEKTSAESIELDDKGEVSNGGY